MAEFSEIITGLGSTVGATLKWGALVLLLIVLLGAVAFWVFNKKKWNLKVEFKFPRSDGGFLYSEHGKGRFDAMKGSCLIKRPGMKGKRYEIKSFDPKKYIQGTDCLTVIQTGPIEFMPVIPSSFYEVQDETGAKALIMEMKADSTSDIGWMKERNMQLLNAYTITNFLQQNAQMIGIGIVIAITVISNYIGVGMILDRLPK